MKQVNNICSLRPPGVKVFSVKVQKVPFCKWALFRSPFWCWVQSYQSLWSTNIWDPLFDKTIRAMLLRYPFGGEYPPDVYPLASAIGVCFFFTYSIPTCGLVNYIRWFSIYRSERFKTSILSVSNKKGSCGHKWACYTATTFITTVPLLCEQVLGSCNSP